MIYATSERELANGQTNNLKDAFQKEEIFPIMSYS
jgi:hypothetical protein